MTRAANLVALARRAILGVGSIVTLTADGRLPIATGWDVVIEEQYAPGGNAGASIAGWNLKRNLNTVIRNTIGATLVSGVVGLPAGDYQLEWDVTAFNTQGHQGRLWNVGAGTVVGYGMHVGTNPAAGTESVAPGSAYASFATETSLRIDHYTALAVANYGLGQGLGQGTETFTRFRARKLS